MTISSFCRKCLPEREEERDVLGGDGEEEPVQLHDVVNLLRAELSLQLGVGVVLPQDDLVEPVNVVDGVVQ